MNVCTRGLAVRDYFFHAIYPLDVRVLNILRC